MLTKLYNDLSFLLKTLFSYVLNISICNQVLRTVSLLNKHIFIIAKDEINDLKDILFIILSNFLCTVNKFPTR